MKLRNIAAVVIATGALSVGSIAYAEGATAEVSTADSVITAETAETAESLESAGGIESTAEVTAEAQAADTAEALTAVDEEKGSPSTGVEGVAVAVAAIILAGAGIAMSRKQ